MSAPQKLQDPEPVAPSVAWTLWLERGVQGLVGEQLGDPAVPPDAVLDPALDDVAELLGEGAGAGRVVLALERLPAEDVGILRRFLARSAQRELVVLSSPEALLDPPTGLASLLTLPRTRLLPAPKPGGTWEPAYVALLTAPPEALRALAPPSGEPNGTPTAAIGAPPEETGVGQSWRVLRSVLGEREELAPLLRRLDSEVARHDDDKEEHQPDPVDLGAVAEELLAGLSLERDRRMRFLYRPEGDLELRSPRPALEACLRHLFDLVGKCSSPDCVIRVRVSSAGAVDSDQPVETTVEFPDAPLTDLPAGAELDPDTLARHFGPDASATLRQLRSQAQSLGAELRSLPSRAGRRQLRLRLPRA